MMINNIRLLFDRYIEKFYVINKEEDGFEELHKWIAAKKFREHMDVALASDGETFIEELDLAYEDLKKFIIYKDAFAGLILFARADADAVKKLLADLFEEDNGDLAVRQQKIDDFIFGTTGLMAQYTPDSFQYKQTAQVVSTLLFYYEPDTHYMYNRRISKEFARIIKFYVDWDRGEKYRLERYHRMCDMLINEIRSYAPLSNTNDCRHRLNKDHIGEDMIPDKELHMLLYDIMKCCVDYGIEVEWFE